MEVCLLFLTEYFLKTDIEDVFVSPPVGRLKYGFNDHIRVKVVTCFSSHFRQVS